MKKYAASFYETYYDTVISQLDRKNIVIDWRTEKEIMIVHAFRTPYIRTLEKLMNISEGGLFEAQVFLRPDVDATVFPFVETNTDNTYTKIGDKNHRLLQGAFDIVLDRTFKVWDVDRDAPLDTKYVKSQTKKQVPYLTKEADRIAKEFIKKGGLAKLYEALKDFPLTTKAKKPVTDHERKIFELFIEGDSYMLQAVQLAQTLGHNGIIISAIEQLGYSPKDLSKLFSMAK